MVAVSLERAPERAPCHLGVRSVTIVVGLLFAACASAQKEGGNPVAVLADTAEASERFAEIRREWIGASSDERIAFEPRVVALRTRFANEPVVRVADVYLAWIALEKGELAAARSTASRAGARDPGTVRDLGQLLEGAALSREGDAEGALALLLPLDGKLIDGFARELFHGESVRAALAAHRWQDVIRLLDGWLRDAADEDRSAILALAGKLLLEVPAPALDRALTGMRADDADSPGRHAAQLERLLARRLLAIATERGLDARTVAGQDLALLVAEATPTVRHRSTEATRGAMGASQKGEARERLRIRGDGGTVEATKQALVELAASGAVVVLGGFDRETSRALAEQAELENIVVLLFVAPARPPQGAQWAFVLGPPMEEGDSSVLDALAARGAKTIAVVGAERALATLGEARVLPPVDCANFSREHQPTRYPVAEWRRARVDALLLAGDSRCTEDVLQEMRAARFAPVVGLGVESATAALPPPPGTAPGRPRATHALAASMGCFPLAAKGASWWQVLGGDAVAVASRAIPRGAEPSDLKSRRLAARAELARQGASPCLGVTPHGVGTPPTARFTVTDGQ